MEELNNILRQSCIYEKRRFAGVKLEDQTRHLLGQKPQGDDLIRLNRMLLEDAYPLEISSNRSLQPLRWKIFDLWYGPATQIRSMAEIKRKIKDEIGSAGDVAKVLDQHLNDIDYVLSANFDYCGTQKIAAELESWARKEAKKFPDRARGRAVLPPYDYLKWLAAYRLEKARRQARVSFDAVQAMLREEDRGGSNCAPTLPIYASPGAWSKAKSDAVRLLNDLESNPAEFERKILF